MNQPRSSLFGNTALVTGAGRRLGRAISLALAEHGVNVVAHYRLSSEETASLCAELERLGVKAWALAADFARPEEAQELVARALQAAGRLDFLIQSASIFRPSTLDDVDFAGLVEHMQINAWTPLVLAREFVRRARTGKIIHLLDSRVSDGDPAHLAYIISKQALAELTRMMALAWAPAVTVNGVAPGLILPPPGGDEDGLRRMANALPLKRHGDAADVARAVLYLLQSDFVTGEVLFVDGGRQLKEESLGPHRHS